MSLEEAYSTELNRIVNAFEAYDLYWNNQLKDKHNFECIGENCSGQVTCACMDILEHELKQVPHFRIKDENHSPECNYLNNIKKNKSNSKDTTETSSNIGSHHQKSTIEKFNFKRPASHTENIDIESPSKPISIDIKNNTKSSYNSGSNITPFYSINPVLSRWIKYREENTVDKNKINIEREITYKDLFRCVFDRDINKQTDKNFIYYGQAFVNRKKDDSGYQLTFTKKFFFKLGDKKINPKIFISDKTIEKYFVKNMLIKRIEKILSQDVNICTVFIYSYPKLVQDKYINFPIDSLDLLDIRQLNYYDKIYSSKPNS